MSVCIIFGSLYILDIGGHLFALSFLLYMFVPLFRTILWEEKLLCVVFFFSLLKYNIQLILLFN